MAEHITHPCPCGTWLHLIDGVQQPHEHYADYDPEAPATTRHEIIEAAVAAIEPSVTNTTHAWNIWNNIASDARFVRAILETHGCGVIPTTENVGEMAHRALVTETEHPRCGHGIPLPDLCAHVSQFDANAPFTEEQLDAAVAMDTRVSGPQRERVRLILEAAQEALR